MNKRIEQRTLADKYQMQLRAASGEENSRILEGYAIVFNEKSEVLYDPRQRETFFREVIAPTAINDELLTRSDIKLTMYHNREKMLARSKANQASGEGTLSWEIREDGVFMWAEMPDTIWGNESVALAERGDISSMSFAFIDGRGKESVEWTKDEDGTPLRTVREIGEVFDFTVCADPAYPQTSVEKREAEQACQTEEEQQAEDAEDIAADEAAEQAARERRCRMFGTVNYDLTNF